MRHAIVWLLVAGCLAADQGCTAALWRQATDRYVAAAGVTSTVALPDGRQALVVVYGTPRDDNVARLLIPLDPAGRPVPPFDFDESPLAYWPDSNGSRRGVILRQAGLLTDAPIPAADCPAAGRPACDDACTDSDLRAFAYRLDPGGGVTVVPFAGHDSIHGPHLAAGAHAVIVPLYRDRTPSAGARAVARAALLTPLAVATDAAVTATVIVCLPFILPVLLLYASSPGDHC